MSPTRYHYATLLVLFIYGPPAFYDTHFHKLISQSCLQFYIDWRYLQFMFHIPTNSPRVNKCENTQLNNLQKKNMQFRQSIRKQQIEAKLKLMREEILASLSEDYHILKNINLNETIRRFMEVDELDIHNNWQELEILTSDIFIYSRSDQSDHLHFMFDEKIIAKLISLLKIDSISCFDQNPRTYIRILWIMANYLSYSPEHNQSVQSILVQLFIEITSLKQFYSSKIKYNIFTHSQTRQILEIVLFSINNLTLTDAYLMIICLNSQQQKPFINILIEQFQKLAIFTKDNIIKETFIPSILSKILNLFENILKLRLSDSIIMHKIYAIDFRIVNILLQLFQILSKDEKEPSIEYQIIVILRQFLFSHLYSKPQIILSHNFILIFKALDKIAKKITQSHFLIINYDNMLEIEGEVKPSLTSLKKSNDGHQKKMIQLLECFIIIFGLNFPQQNNEKYYDTYYAWIQDHLAKNLCSIFKASFDSYDQIRYKCLQMLRNICLQQQFCEVILGKLPIMSKIFYYLHSDSVGIRLKKSALGVLNSIICITLEGDSDLRREVIEILMNNKIFEIFTKFIGQYVDQPLNKNLLESIILFLNTQIAQDPKDHLFWAEFCRQGGIQKLQKYHSNVQNREIQDLIQNVLNAFKQ